MPDRDLVDQAAEKLAEKWPLGAWREQSREALADALLAALTVDGPVLLLPAEKCGTCEGRCNCTQNRKDLHGHYPTCRGLALGTEVLIVGIEDDPDEPELLRVYFDARWKQHYVLAGGPDRERIRQAWGSSQHLTMARPGSFYCDHAGHDHATEAVDG